MNKVRQADFGTPVSTRAETVKVEIDGLPATVRAGTTILRAARESGVDIPKLCAARACSSRPITFRPRNARIANSRCIKEGTLVTLSSSKGEIAPAEHRSDWQHNFDENTRLQAELLETAE